MSGETMSSIKELQSLSCAPLFEPAVASLSAAAQSTRPAVIQEHLQRAMPYLRHLSPSMQRLAWLQSYGMPRERRRGPARAQSNLWCGGINRIAEPCPHTSGLARLAMGWSDAPHGSGSALLREIASTRGFGTLADSATDEELTWEGVWMMHEVDPRGCRNIRILAADASLNRLAEVAALAEWLHALATEDAASMPPPDSPLTEIALVLTQLRGLRRRGARNHGRRIGRQVRQATQSLSRGSKRELALALPSCLSGGAALRPMLAPLVQDLLSCAVAELALNSDLLQGTHTLSECCPLLLDQAIETHVNPGTHDSIDRTCRRSWLASLLGLLSYEEHAAASGASLNETPKDPNDP